MNRSEQPTAIFVADSHFHLEPDSAEQRRLALFVDLLERSRDADHLILLGDIFDFWFDYPHFRLRGYEILLQALDTVRNAGTTIHFVGGNHDIWAATYMRRRYGCAGDGETQLTRFGDVRVNLCHGDGLLKLDWAYNGFRAMVRNRFGIALAKSLHPEILFALSSWLSGRSRCVTRDEAEVIERRAAAWLARHAQAPWDLMVIGHLHHGFRVDAESRSLVALPGWLDTLGYGLLQDGVFTTRDFENDPWPKL